MYQVIHLHYKNHLKRDFLKKKVCVFNGAKLQGLCIILLDAVISLHLQRWELCRELFSLLHSMEMRAGLQRSRVERTTTLWTLVLGSFPAQSVSWINKKTKQKKWIIKPMINAEFFLEAQMARLVIIKLCEKPRGKVRGTEKKRMTNKVGGVHYCDDGYFLNICRTDCPEEKSMRMTLI